MRDAESGRWIQVVAASIVSRGPLDMAHDEEAPIGQLVAPERIGDLSERVVDDLKVGAALEEDVVESQQRHPGLLGVTGCVGGQRG